MCFSSFLKCVFSNLCILACFLSLPVKVHRGRELTGVQCFSSISPVSTYEHMRLHRRILGHLSAVYCIAFDRTGLRIFTVRWHHSAHVTLETYNGARMYHLRGMSQSGVCFSVSVKREWSFDFKSPNLTMQ